MLGGYLGEQGLLAGEIAAEAVVPHRGAGHAAPRTGRSTGVREGVDEEDQEEGEQRQEPDSVCIGALRMLDGPCRHPEGLNSGPHHNGNRVGTPQSISLGKKGYRHSNVRRCIVLQQDYCSAHRHG